MNTQTCLLTLTVLSSTALAGLIPGTTYDNRADFNNDTGALSLEDFESESLGDLTLPNSFDSGLSLDLTSGDVSVLIEAGDPDLNNFHNTTDGGRNYLRFGRNIEIPGAPIVPETGSYTAAFSFANSVNAFGFDLSGFLPLFAADGFNVTTLNNGQIIDDFFHPSDQVISPEFYGFIMENAFDEFRINIPVLNFPDFDADYVAFDDVAWGAVPSPSAISILGLAGIAASRRRR